MRINAVGKSEALGEIEIMTDFIIIGILVVLIGFGVRSTIKHFRHESDCCSGSTYKAREKKLGNIIAKRIIKVEGMTCQHCENRVMEAVNAIDGVSAVVNLKKGTVTVSMSHEIEDEVIKNAIEKAGYEVKGIM